MLPLCRGQARVNQVPPPDIFVKDNLELLMCQALSERIEAWRWFRPFILSLKTLGILFLSK